MCAVLSNKDSVWVLVCAHNLVISVCYLHIAHSQWRMNVRRPCATLACILCQRNNSRHHVALVDRCVARLALKESKLLVVSVSLGGIAVSSTLPCNGIHSGDTQLAVIYLNKLLYARRALRRNKRPNFIATYTCITSSDTERFS